MTSTSMIDEQLRHHPRSGPVQVALYDAKRRYLERVSRARDDRARSEAVGDYYTAIQRVVMVHNDKTAEDSRYVGINPLGLGKTADAALDAAYRRYFETVASAEALLDARLVSQAGTEFFAEVRRVVIEAIADYEAMARPAPAADVAREPEKKVPAEPAAAREPATSRSVITSHEPRDAFRTPGRGEPYYGGIGGPASTPYPPERPIAPEPAPIQSTAPAVSPPVTAAAKPVDPSGSAGTNDAVVAARKRYEDRLTTAWADEPAVWPPKPKKEAQRSKAS